MWSKVAFWSIMSISSGYHKNIELFVTMPQDGKDNSHLVCTLFGFKCKSFPDVNILPGYLCLYLSAICTISLSRNFPMHQNKGSLENYIIIEWYWPESFSRRFARIVLWEIASNYQKFRVSLLKSCSVSRDPSLVSGIKHTPNFFGIFTKSAIPKTAIFGTNRFRARSLPVV